MTLKQLTDIMLFRKFKRDKKDLIYHYQNNKYEGIEKLLSKMGYCLNVKKISAEFRLLEKFKDKASPKSP